MRILSAFTDFLIQQFKITDQELSYKHLMLVASLLISIVGLIGFSILSYIDRSYALSIVLGSSAIISLINLIVLKVKISLKASSYFFIATFLFTMAYLIFDVGRSGLGYFWFYAIPIINISILGARKGTIASLFFFVYLLVVFAIPDYYIDSEYYPILKVRLLLSFLALTLVTLYKEWTVELFKKHQKDVDEVLEVNLENKRSAIKKLSNQIHHVTNEIISSVARIKKEKPKQNIIPSVNSIHDSSLNLINIISSLGELSENSFINENKKEDYDLSVELESTANLFSSYKVDISINVEKSLPEVLHGDPLPIKQIIYNIIDNFVTEDVDKIDIRVYKGEETEEFLELKYQVIDLLIDGQEKGIQKQDIKFVDLNTNTDYSERVEKLGLKSILPLVRSLDGKVALQKSKDFLSICFNQKIAKGEEYNPQVFSESRYPVSDIASGISNDVYKKKLNKMRVLLMEDNPIAQKSILFALDKVVKYLDIADNGKQGLDLFYKNKYDLILMDINMPLIDGYEAARKIRNIELGSRLHIPIIAIISNYLAKDIEEIKACGIDDYIIKPLKTSDLLLKINLLSLREKQ